MQCDNSKRYWFLPFVDEKIEPQSINQRHLGQVTFYALRKLLCTPSLHVKINLEERQRRYLPLFFMTEKDHF